MTFAPLNGEMFVKPYSVGIARLKTDDANSFEMI